MNIVLIGFMGSGKSSVAKYLSRLTGFSHIEMDELVYQKTGASNMHEVFAFGGELLLRETEIALAKEYADKKNLVISTGGGAVLNKISLDYLKKGGGKVFFLRAQFDTIVRRLVNDHSRPLFADARALYDFRLPLYINYADVTLDVDSLSIEDIALHVQRQVVG